jgi:hypothetical protein
MKTNSASRIGSWAVMAVAAISTNAGASIVNGFEAPTFATGSIHGQAGWESTNTLTSVSTANARSGSQHLRLETSQSDPQPQAFGPTGLSSSERSASMWFSIDSVNSTFSLHGITSGFLTSWGMMVMSGDVYLLGNDAWFDSGLNIGGAGEYQQFATVYNNDENTRDYYLNGELFYHQTTGLLSGLSTVLLNVSLGPGSSNQLDIDDIGTFVVPAPGSIALACMGGLIAGRRRR